MSIPKPILAALIPIGLCMLAGCELTSPSPLSPTAPVTPEPTVTVLPTEIVAQPSAIPTASVSPVARLESPSPTFTPGLPTATLPPSATPGPYEYVIQQDDTLLYIIQQPPFNYRDTLVLDEILRLNPQILDINRLPPPGSTILIPRQTTTPTPEGYDLTRAVLPPMTDTPIPVVQLEQHIVVEGETILGVAESNSTTLSALATLNPEIGFFGCDFNSPFGGSGCTVSLIVGQTVNVPALTPTPTLSPTFSGSETPTSTPTYAPPEMIFPPQNANASARTFQLQWLSAGILQPNEYYVVQIEDTTSGATHLDVTRNTSYELPSELIPGDGQPHIMRWRVGIGVPNPEGAFRLVGGEGEWRTFQWQSR